MNFLDKAIAPFAPTWAANRARAACSNKNV